MNSEILLERLQPEIKEKCKELRIRKKEKKLKRVFAFSAVLLFVLPIFLVIQGYSFRSAYIAVSILELIMLIISAPDMIVVFKGEKNYVYRQKAV